MWWKLKSNTFCEVLHIPLRLVLWTTIYIMIKWCIWNIYYNIRCLKLQWIMHILTNIQVFKTSMDHAYLDQYPWINSIPSINLILAIIFFFYSNTVYFNWPKLAKPTTFLSLLRILCCDHIPIDYGWWRSN